MFSPFRLVFLLYFIEIVAVMLSFFSLKMVILDDALTVFFVKFHIVIVQNIEQIHVLLHEEL